MYEKNNVLTIIVSFFLIFFLFTHNTRAGTSYISEWNITSNLGTSLDEANDAAVDSVGNIIVVGFGRSGTVYYYWNITKLGKDGEFIWNYTYNSTFGTSQANGVAVDSEDNFVVVGFDKASSLSGDYGWMIMKFDKSNSQLWNVSYNPSSSDDRAFSVAIDNDNNITVVGYNVSSGTDYGWLIMKFDKNGNSLWNKSFNFGGFSDQALDVAIDNDNNITVVGIDSISLINSEWRIMKFDKNGNVLKNYYEDFSPSIDQAWSVAIDNDNNIIVVGLDENKGSNNDRWRIMKFDKNLNSLWNNTPDISTTHDGAKGVTIDSFNNITVVGYDNSTGNWEWSIMKFGYDNTSLWNYSYDPSNYNDAARSVAIDRNDDSIVVVGHDRITQTNSEWRIMKFVTCDHNSTFCSQYGYNWTGTKCCEPGDNYVETPPYNNQLCVSGSNKTCETSTSCDTWIGYFCNNTDYIWHSGDGISHTCDYSLWNDCQSICIKMRDVYKCNGQPGPTGSCIDSVLQDTAPVSASSLCDGGSEKESNSTFFCEADKTAGNNCTFIARECSGSGTCDGNNPGNTVNVLADKIYYGTDNCVSNCYGDADASHYCAVTCAGSPGSGCTFEGEECSDSGSCTNSYGVYGLNIPAGQVCRVNSLGSPDSSYYCNFACADYYQIGYRGCAGTGGSTCESTFRSWYNCTLYNKYCDSGACTQGTLIINSIEILPTGTVNPITGSNVPMNVTVNITNSTYMAPEKNCTVRIFNSTMSYSSPVKGPYNGTIQKSDSQWQCLQNWSMEYWQNPGPWNVSVNLTLWTGVNNFTSKNFTYGSLYAWNDNITTGCINWTGLPGQTVNSSNAYPMLVNNTGNVRVNISINGSNFINGPYEIGVGNASFSNTTSSGPYYNLSKTLQSMISLGMKELGYVYFRAYIPIGFISQYYNNNILMNQSY